MATVKAGVGKYGKSWLIDMGLPVAKSTVMNHPQVVGAVVLKDLMPSITS